MIKKRKPSYINVRKVTNTHIGCDISLQMSYLVHYVCEKSCLWLNKVRRNFVSRFKRALKHKYKPTKFWIGLGRLVFIFKARLNARMGGGLSSFYTLRRFLRVGMVFVKFLSKRLGYNKIAVNNIIRKVPTQLKIYMYKKTKNFHRILNKKKGLRNFRLIKRYTYVKYKVLKKKRKKFTFRDALDLVRINKMINAIRLKKFNSCPYFRKVFYKRFYFKNNKFNFISLPKRFMQI